LLMEASMVPPPRVKRSICQWRGWFRSTGKMCWCPAVKRGGRTFTSQRKNNKERPDHAKVEAIYHRRHENSGEQSKGKERAKKRNIWKLETMVERRPTGNFERRIWAPKKTREGGDGKRKDRGG